MTHRKSRLAVWIATAARPRLTPFPVALFSAALVTDLVYWASADPLWSTMSSWLLLGGLTLATIAVMAELVRVLGDPGFRRRRPIRVDVAGNALAVAVSVVNFIFHVRDGYSAVVPAGPLLSAAVVLILLLTGWVERRVARRHATLAQAPAAA